MISERVGCTRLERGMRDFFGVLQQYGTPRHPMLGRKFTWTNYQNHAIHSRLDRFLLSQDYLDKFKVVQWGLERLILDHCLISITDDNRDCGPKPFCFMDIWLNDPKCMKLAKEVWEGTQVSGWSGFVIAHKLRAVKDWLKLWNKEEFGDINCALQDTEAKRHVLDTLAEVRELNEEEKALRCLNKSEFWRLSKLQESLWK